MTQTGVAANEARALHARLHMALVSQNVPSIQWNFYTQTILNTFPALNFTIFHAYTVGSESTVKLGFKLKYTSMLVNLFCMVATV